MRRIKPGKTSVSETTGYFLVHFFRQRNNRRVCENFINNQILYSVSQNNKQNTSVHKKGPTWEENLIF